MISDNGGREVEKDETKKKKKKKKERREIKESWGGQTSAPTPKLSLRLSQLSQVEFTQSTQKKKKKNFLF